LLNLYHAHGVGAVEARSDAGEGLGARKTVALVVSRLDLSREEWARCTGASEL
jgi:hypothetical protein